MRARSAIVGISEGSLRDTKDRASRSHSTSPLPPLCTPATHATPHKAKHEGWGLANLRSSVLFSEEHESIAKRESAVWKREMRCREGGYDRRVGTGWNLAAQIVLA